MIKGMVPEYCPCGSGLPVGDCCGRYLSGKKSPPTAELLMRSRYTAYVFGDRSYLDRTWHPDTRPLVMELDDDAHWLGLKVVRIEAGGEGDETGLVEFIARYKIAGRGYRLHEISHFVRHEGRWVYRDGVMPEKK